MSLMSMIIGPSEVFWFILYWILVLKILFCFYRHSLFTSAIPLHFWICCNMTAIIYITELFNLQSVNLFINCIIELLQLFLNSWADPHFGI